MSVYEPKALVIIPTHNHGELICLSIASVLRQTYTNFELHIIGDGATADTVAAVESMLPLDSRIHWHSCTKSARTGEVYRDEIIRTYGAADGFVAYLSDDDLWFSDHLALCARGLQSADVTHMLPWLIYPSQVYHYTWCDWSLPWYRYTVRMAQNRMPLGSMAHSVQSYLSLSAGWQSTPVGIPTDHYMWQKFLAHPGLTYSSTPKPTVVHLPSSVRPEVTLAERLAELTVYANRLQHDEPGLRAEAIDGYIREVLKHVAQLEKSQHHSWLPRDLWKKYKTKYFDRSRLAKYLRDSGAI